MQNKNSKARRINTRNRLFDIFYQEYKDSNNYSRFLGQLYQETRRYCFQYLSRDSDIVSDFFVYLLEGRIDNILYEYKIRNHSSFAGFYITCIRNSFYNFHRYHQRFCVEALPLHEEPASAYNPFNDQYFVFWHELDTALQELPAIDRIIFKLYHSIPLHSHDLRNLIESFGVDTAKSILNQIDDRQRYREERLLEIDERLNRSHFKTLRGRRSTCLSKPALDTLD